MSDRERLIEILDTAKIKQEFRSSTGVVTGLYHAKIVNSDYVKPLVELLIANGVTIQRHGRWIKISVSCGIDVLECSECHAVHPNRGDDYCRDCGAKMDEEAIT